MYLCSAEYNPQREHTIAAIDPTLAIDWPSGHELRLSDRDAAAPSFGRSPRRRPAADVGSGASVYPRIVWTPGGMTYPHGATLLAVIASAATLTACSSKSEPTSHPARVPVPPTTTAQAIPGSGAAPAELMVDGHIHNISGPVNCTAQAPNPTAKFPLGNLAISASDDTASFAMSWLSNAKSPLMALTLSLQGGCRRVHHALLPSATQYSSDHAGQQLRGQRDAPGVVARSEHAEEPAGRNSRHLPLRGLLSRNTVRCSGLRQSV